MATIQAKRIKDALKKVQRVGRIEEATNIAGCEVSLQNLSPQEFESALQACEGLEDVAYAHAYQFEQVSRSIVEIDGQDLRDAEFIEEEVPVGQYILELVLPNKLAAEAIADKLKAEKLHVSIIQQTDGTTKTVRLERHQWLKDNVLNDWGREALTVAWRKFTEVLIKADEHAKKNVQFLVPDESAEDKFRRLLKDLKETEEELPDELINSILDDAGLLKKSTKEELDTANASLAQLRTPQASAPAEAPPVPATRPVQAATPNAAPPPVVQPQPAVLPEAIQQAMAGRARLNQQGADIPVPTPSRESLPISASPRVKVPDQIRQAALQNTQGLQGAGNVPQVVAAPGQEGTGIATRRLSRAAEIASLEGQFDPTLDVGDQPPVGPLTQEVSEVSARTRGPTTPAKDVRSILDRPPVVGINKKFQPRDP